MASQVARLRSSRGFAQSQGLRDTPAFRLPFEGRLAERLRWICRAFGVRLCLRDGRDACSRKQTTEASKLAFTNWLSLCEIQEPTPKASYAIT